jgi:CheY-like chemotaxis protein
MNYLKYATTVIGAYSVPDWYEALDRLVAVRQLSMASMADAQFRAGQAAILDQEIASIDVVTGGEMHRRTHNRHSPPNATLRLYTVEILNDLGYMVLAAANGTTALEIIDRRQDIDLLFTDIVMPGGMNGKQLADEAVKRRPVLKVHFTAGYTANAIVHHGRLDPDVALISKPFTYDSLGRKIRALLGEKRDSARD